MAASTQNLVVTRRTALVLAATAAAAGALPALPGRAAESAPVPAGPLEVISYDAIGERGCGVTRISTPWYSLTLEDALLPQGACWEYDEPGLGFDALGVTEACSVLRVYDRGTGEVVCAAYLTNAAEASEPPLGGTWCSSAFGEVEGLTLVLACPVAAPADEAALELAREKVCTLGASLCANDRDTHLTCDAQAGTATVEMPLYTVTIPNDMFPQGWRYTYGGPNRAYADTGLYMGEHIKIVPIGQDEEAFGAYVTNGVRVEGDYDFFPLGNCLAGSWEDWELVAYAPAGSLGDGRGEQRDLQETLAFMLAHKPQGNVEYWPSDFAVWEDAGLRVVTPHHSVLVPLEQAGPGLAWSCSQGSSAQELAEGESTHVTRIDLDRDASFEVFCQADPAGSQEGAEPVGFTSPDGLDVFVRACGDGDSASFAGMVCRADVSSWARYATEQYFLYTVDEGDAQRIVTPYYSVRIPNGVYGDSFDYDFEHGTPLDLIQYEGAMIHRMKIGFYEQGEPVGWFEIYCLEGDHPAGDGPVAIARSGVSSSDGLHVDAYCMFDWNPGGELPPNAVTYEQAQAMVDEYVLMIEPAPANAPVIERLRHHVYADKPGEANGERPSVE